MLKLFTVQICYDKNENECITKWVNDYSNSTEESIIKVKNKYSKKGKVRWATCVLGLPKNIGVESDLK